MAAPFSIKDLEADPTFAALSADAQDEKRKKYFMDFVALDPDFQSLDQPTKLGLTQALLDREPVFENPLAPEVQSARQRAALLDAGDPAVQESVIQRETTKAELKNTLTGAIMSAGKDVFEHFYGGEDSPLVLASGKENEKISRLEQTHLARSPGMDPTRLANFQSSSAVLGMITSLAEGMGSSFAVGLVGGGSKLAMSTEALGQTMKSGFLQRVVSGLGEQTYQGLAGASLSAFQRVATDGLNGDWGRQNLGTIASNFGADFAMNYGAWVGFSAVASAAKVVRAVFRKPEMVKTAAEVAGRSVDDMVADLGNTMLKTQGDLDAAVLDQMSPEAKAEILNSTKGLRSAMVSAKLTTPEDKARVIITSAGYTHRVEGTQHILTSIEDGVDRASYDSLSDAVDYAARNRDVHNAPPGGRLADSNVRLEYKDVVEAPRVDDPRKLAQLYEDARPESRVDSRKYVAKQLFEQSGVPTKDLRFEPVDNAAIFGEAGVKGETAVDPEAVRRSIASAANEGTVYVPKDAFESASQEAMYLDGLRRAVQEAGGDTKLGLGLEAALKPGSRGSLDSVSRASKTAMSGLAKSVYGPDARVVNLERGAFAVTVPDPAAPPTAELFGQAGRRIVLSSDGEQSFRLSLLSELRKAGALSTDQVAWAVSQSTGLTLHEVKKTPRGAKAGATISTFELRSPSGAVLHTFTSLDDVMKESSLFGRMVLFPDEFAPKAYVSNPAKNEITFEGALAEGRLIDVLDLAAQYDKPFTGLTAGVNKVPIPGKDGTAFYSGATRTFTFKPYEGAAPRTYTSLKSLKTAVAHAQGSLDSFRNDARARGFELVIDQRGVATLYDGKDMLSFTSRRELRQYFKKHPIADAPELVPTEALDPKLEGEVTADLSKLTTEAASFGAAGKGPVAGFERLWQKAMHPITPMKFVGVTQSTLAAHAQQSGNDTLLRAFHSFKTGERVVTAENRKYVRFADEIWGRSSADRREMLGTLLSVDRRQWKDVALNLYERELTPDDELRLDKATSFLNTFLKANGLDDLSAIYSRKADIQAAVQAALNSGTDLPEDAVAFVKATLGSEAPRSLSLFADGLSRTDLLNFFDEKDPAVATLAIIDKVNRQRVFGPLRKELAGAVASASKAVQEGTLPRSALQFFSDSLDEAQGIKTSAALDINEKARSVSYGLAKFVEKSKFLKRLGLGEDLRTDDLLGKLGQIFTNNSQAFRAWAIPRNLTQVMNVGAITGNSKMWRAFQYVLDNPTYVDDLYARGAMQESILSMGGEAFTPLQKMQRVGLAPLEVSDALTRATAIRAAEEAFNEALPRFEKGITNARQFRRECFADFLEAPEQKQFDELLLKNPAAARDFLGQSMQRVTMFDYARGSMGRATHGTIGKLFGKMGTYPLHQIDLYRRILANGSWGERFARATRLVATSYAIYYAFDSAGVTYDGFLWSDPFSYSGGPYWTILNDALNAVGDRPENKMARADLLKRTTSALVPGAMLAPYAQRAVAAVQSGDTLELLKAMGTVPMSQEERLRRQAYANW